MNSGHNPTYCRMTYLLLNEVDKYHGSNTALKFAFRTDLMGCMISLLASRRPLKIGGGSQRPVPLSLITVDSAIQTSPRFIDLCEKLVGHQEEWVAKYGMLELRPMYCEGLEEKMGPERGGLNQTEDQADLASGFKWKRVTTCPPEGMGTKKAR